MQLKLAEKQQLIKELGNLKDQALINFTKGIGHSGRELAEMMVLTQNQIYGLADKLQKILEQND